MCLGMCATCAHVCNMCTRVHGYGCVCMRAHTCMLTDARDHSPYSPLLWGRVSRLTPELADRTLLTRQLAPGNPGLCPLRIQDRPSSPPGIYICLLGEHFNHRTIAPGAICCDCLGDRAVGEEGMALPLASEQTGSCFFWRKNTGSKHSTQQKGPNFTVAGGVLSWINYVGAR